MNHLSRFSVFPFILRPSQCSCRVSQSFLRSIQDVPRGCPSPSLKVSSTSEGTYVRTDFHMDGLMGRYVRPYPDLWKLSSIILCVLRQIVPFGVARQMGKKGGGSYERIEGGGERVGKLNARKRQTKDKQKAVGVWQNWFQRHWAFMSRENRRRREFPRPESRSWAKGWCIHVHLYII